MNKTVLFICILLAILSCKQQSNTTKTDKINSTITNVEVKNIPNLSTLNPQYQKTILMVIALMILYFLSLQVGHIVVI